MGINLNSLTLRRKIGGFGLASLFVAVGGMFVHSPQIAIGGAAIWLGTTVYGIATQ